MKDIVILADFCGPFDGKFNSRFLYLADMLSKDNNVEIITSDFNHGSKKYFEHQAKESGYVVTMLHEGAYPTNVCWQRFYAHYIWGKSVRKYLRKRKKPDVIYCAIPTLQASYEAAKYCQINDIRFVIDVQDLWPEAFQMIFHFPLISDIIFLPFKSLANGIYKRADAICAVSDTYCQRALSVNKKCKESLTVFLGTELAIFDKYVLERPILEKKEGEIWVAYCGTLGSSYDLTAVIDALYIVSDEKIKFVVMGDGPRKKEFESYAKKKGVNAIFVGMLSYDVMCSLLASCDITVNPIAHMAAQSIINKHADYAASGLPVISTQESSEYRKLVTDYDMGFNCKNGDAADIAEKILLLSGDEQLRKKMGANARKCAEERFDRKNTYLELTQVICSEKAINS